MRFLIHLLVVCLAGWLACRPRDEKRRAARRRSRIALLLIANLGLGSLGYWLASELSLALPVSSVVGRWTVLNNDEPHLMAVWEFSRAPRGRRREGPLLVRGAVCLAKTLGSADDASTWCGLTDFGPHPVRLDRRAGTAELDYSSSLGAGKAQLTLAQAYVGNLVDDKNKTEASQVDTSSVAMVREGERGKQRQRAHRIGSLWILACASLLSLLVLKLAWRNKPAQGVFACWLWFAALTLSLCWLSSWALVVAREARGLKAGDRWLLEYLSQRARVGRLDAVETQLPLHLSGTLSTRQRIERGKFESGPLDQSLLGDRLRFDYQAKVGTGSARLVRTRALYGYFFDVLPRDESPPAERLEPHPCPATCETLPTASEPEPNFGDLIAIREELPLGEKP